MDELTPIAKNAVKMILTNTFSNTTGSINSSTCTIENTSTITSMDMANSMLYARHRILRDKCDALSASGAGVAWTSIYPDGTVPYNCPDSRHQRSAQHYGAGQPLSSGTEQGHRS